MCTAGTRTRIILIVISYAQKFPAQHLGNDIFINVTSLHLEVMGKVKITENESWMSCGGRNMNQGRNFK